MIVHIVMFKFQDENKDSNIEIVKGKLLQLDKDLSLIKKMEVGVDFNQSERAYDLVLYTHFDSKEDLNSYAVDDKHQEVVKFIKSVTIDTKVVDYIL